VHISPLVLLCLVYCLPPCVWHGKYQRTFKYHHLAQPDSRLLSFGCVGQLLTHSFPSRETFRDEIYLVSRPSFSQPGLFVPRAVEGPTGPPQQQRGPFPTSTWPHQQQAVFNLGGQLPGSGPRLEQLLHLR